MTSTVAVSTRHLYEERVQSFLRAVPSLDSPDRWTNPRAWALELKRRNLSKASVKAYASAIRFLVRRELGASADCFLATFDPLYEQIRDAAGKAIRPPRPRITDEVMLALSRAVSDRYSSSKYAYATGKLALAIYHFGLRPSEWERARLEGNSIVVRNGKFLRRIMEHGLFKGRLFARANGVSRTIEIEDAERGEELRRVAKDAIGLDLDWTNRRSAYAREFKNLVRYAVNRGWLDRRYKSITLYSMRHQFSANAKAVLDPADGSVAALMGHIAARTALTSYARRVHGSGKGLGVRPSADSVLAVEDTRVFEMQITEQYGRTQMRAERPDQPRAGATPVVDTKPPIEHSQREPSAPKPSRFANDGPKSTM